MQEENGMVQIASTGVKFNDFNSLNRSYVKNACPCYSTQPSFQRTVVIDICV